jgi:hypothetical protein
LASLQDRQPRVHLVVGEIVHADGPAGQKDSKGLFIDGLGASRLRRSPEQVVTPGRQRPTVDASLAATPWGANG